MYDALDADLDRACGLSFDALNARSLGSSPRMWLGGVFGLNPNGEIIASSERYKANASTENGIKSVQTKAPGAAVVDMAGSPTLLAA